MLIDRKASLTKQLQIWAMESYNSGYEFSYLVLGGWYRKKVGMTTQDYSAAQSICPSGG